MASRISIIVSLIVLAALAGRGLADVAIPGQTRKDLVIQIRLENLDEYPQWDFYLKYGLSRGNPYGAHHLTRMHSGVSTRLEGKGNRLTEVYLLTVPAGQSIRLPTAEWDRDWLTDLPKGALGQAMLLRFQESEDLREYRYRVRIEDGKLHVDKLEVVPVNPDTEPLGASAWFQIGVGIALSSAAVVCGILLWRRWSRSSPGLASLERPEE
jgi:hypothetical protein